MFLNTVFDQTIKIHRPLIKSAYSVFPQENEK